MKAAIIGYGNMGKEIEALLRSRGHKVSAIIDPISEGATAKEITEESLADAEVCIDFTSPKAAVSNVEKMAKLKKNIVLGTTGWYDDMDRVRTIVEKNDIGFIWASNFSIGVNLFFRMIDNASRYIDRMPQYDIYSYEMHHNGKIDSPSGTALTIGNIILGNVERKTVLQTEALHRKIRPEELHIASIRAGTFPGTHVVGFESDADLIELKHENRNRKGLTAGAVMAAEWIKEKKGFHNIDDMMRDMIK